MNDFTVGRYRDWKLYLFGGIVFIILGILALAVPHIVSIAMGILLALLLLFGGIVHLFNAFSGKKGATFVLSAILSILLIVAAVLLLIHPVYSVMAITLMLSIYLFVQGVIQIIASFALRPLKSWGWILFTGIVAILLAIVIWTNWPVSGVSFLGIIFGINLIVWGFSEIMIAISVKSLAGKG